MVKKATTEEAVETKENLPAPTNEVPVTEPQPDLVQLQTQLQEVEKRLLEERRTTTKHTARVQQLEEELAQAKGDKETQQALMAILAAQQGKGEEEFSEEVQAKKPDLLADYQAFIKTQQAQREQEKYNRSAKAVWNRLLAAGVKEGDDAFFEIRGMLSRGELDWAESKVGKLEAAKQAEASEAAEVKETEAEMRERIKQELLRKTSAFQTETGKPSGAGLSDDDFLKEYSAGKRLTLEDDKRATGIIRKQTGGK